MSEETTTTTAATDDDKMNVVAAGIAKLLALVEADDSAEKVRVDSMIMLREILDTHGKLLKTTLSPENKLHPDVSSYNPYGERDNPRPRLKRPVFVLGVPMPPAQMTWDEIAALNSFTQSLEVPARKWKALILRDSMQNEILYISKPYRNFDDMREFSSYGGLLGICRIIQSEGVGANDPNAQAIQRIQQLEDQVARMQRLIESQTQPTEVSA